MVPTPHQLPSGLMMWLKQCCDIVNVCSHGVGLCKWHLTGSEGGVHCHSTCSSLLDRPPVLLGGVYWCTESWSPWSCAAGIQGGRWRCLQHSLVALCSFHLMPEWDPHSFVPQHMFPEYQASSRRLSGEGDSQFLP